MKCPNCNKEIGRFELAPNCKHCGVNIFYSQQKTLLTRDAKKCELEYAGFRILVSKLKTAFIGGKIQILRIVAMVMAIGAIFVPFGSIGVNISPFDAKFSFGAWGIYSAFTDCTLSALLNLSGYAHKQMVASLVLLGLIVAIFLSGLGVFVALLLSFINIQKSARAMRGLSFVGSILCVGAFVVSALIPSVMSEIGFIEGKTGVGALVCLAVLIFIFILNHLVIKKNIQPQVKEVDLKRVELNKKVKKGEASLEDLPLPVFETEEEKEERLKKEEESRALAQKGKGEDNG